MHGVRFRCIEEMKNAVYRMQVWALN